MQRSIDLSGEDVDRLVDMRDMIDPMRVALIDYSKGSVWVPMRCHWSFPSP